MNPYKSQPESDFELEEFHKLKDDDYRIYANSAIVIGVIIIIWAFFSSPNSFQSQLTPHATIDTIKANGPKYVIAENSDDDLEKKYWAKLGTIGDFTAGVVGTLFAFGGFIYICPLRSKESLMIYNKKLLITKK